MFRLPGVGWLVVGALAAGGWMFYNSLPAKQTFVPRKPPAAVARPEAVVKPRVPRIDVPSSKRPAASEKVSARQPVWRNVPPRPSVDVPRR
ncbi:hypothetical protein [Aquamicrobium sp. LC103]|uniref:hypothetical protein n=1 Tax=Aquamicrobium sp. LC103 TaxID=1120658 RepID=UPI00109D63F7|nr:hypothetical protein [Aquamicrobium sp. LC103]TKT75862.1 hypothetical protein XW59_018705 [Aquamicrobium sp. LC103]